jgi:zinc transporter 7
MRVLSSQAGGEGHSHSHSHSHSHVTTAKTTSIETTDTSSLKSRKVKEELVVPVIEEKQEINPSLKLSAYLNLFGDFTHNITDGLAMAASFYSSPALGAVTTIATFCHEIPHEVSPSSGSQR